MSAGHLIDANVLIALTHRDHEHHERARAWVSGVDQFAVCPIVEGALVRFMIRTGRTPMTVNALLSALHANPRCEFWTDAVSYRDVDLTHVVGHRQVTDAYLACIAADRNSRLATLDQGLAQAMRERVALIP